MSRSSVTVVMTGDSARLLREMEKVLQKETKLRDGTKQTSVAAERTGKSMSAAFGSRALANIAGYVAGMASLTTAVSLANRVMAEHRRLQEENARVNITVAQSQAGLVKNLGDISAAQKQQVLARITQIQSDTGFGDVTHLQQSVGALYSATGDVDRALALAQLTAPLFRDRPEEMTGFAGSVGDLLSASGGQLSDRQAASLLVSAQGRARFETLGEIGKLSPLVAASAIAAPDQAAADNAREAYAIAATLSKQTGKKQAEPVSTAGIALINKLRQEFPELSTTRERLAAAQALPAEERAAFAATGFEQMFKNVVEDLLTPDSKTSRLFAEDFQKVTSDEEAITRLTEQLETLTPQLRGATFQQAAAGNVQSLQLGDDSATVALVRKAVFDTLAQTRTSPLAYLSELSQDIEYGFRATDRESAIKEGQRLIAIREEVVMGGRLDQVDPAEFTALQRQQLDVLDRQYRLLEQMAANGGNTQQSYVNQIQRQNSQNAAQE